MNNLNGDDDHDDDGGDDDIAHNTQRQQQIVHNSSLSLQWVKDLHYLTIVPIERALRQIQHQEGNNDTVVALFYAPDLFPNVNYIHWLRVMTCIVKMLQHDSINKDSVFSKQQTHTKGHAASTIFHKFNNTNNVY